MSECRHHWIAKTGQDGKPDFRLNREMCAVPLVYVTCSVCGDRTWMTEGQFAKEGGQVAPVPKTVQIEESTVDGLCSDLDELNAMLLRKASDARATARKARKRGDVKKWDKFNAVARVYEMIYERVVPIAGVLFDHASDDYCDQHIPF
jgi:hypothetical protein